jgi:hypothetical protein
MKAYWGSGYIVPCIFDLGARWRWVVSFTPRPLYSHGKSPWYPLNRRLGGLQSRSGRGGEEKNSHPQPGLKSPVIQTVAQRCTTELTRLLCNKAAPLSFWGVQQKTSVSMNSHMIRTKLHKTEWKGTQNKPHRSEMENKHEEITYNANYSERTSSEWVGLSSGSGPWSTVWVTVVYFYVLSRRMTGGNAETFIQGHQYTDLNLPHTMWEWLRLDRRWLLNN